MDFLQITRYGNTVQDYVISIIIFFASLIIAKYTYPILRNTVSETLVRAQSFLKREDLIRVSTLFTYLIPILGLAIAQKRLSFNEELATLVSISLLISGQIIFFLILIHIFEPVIEVWSIKYIDLIEQKNNDFTQTQKEAISQKKKNIIILTRISLFLVAGLTIFTVMDVVPWVIWLLPLLIAIFGMGLCYRIIIDTKRYLQKTDDMEAEDGIFVRPEVPSDKDDPDFRTRITIVELFLEIFKHQSGAPAESPAEISLVELEQFVANYVYELRIQINGDWKSRRMTIARLGEDTGSRSKCFYVIYDDYLVIKIPPVQISSIKEYIEILRKESRIANQLAMKECIIPTISVILKHVYHSFNKTGKHLQETEDVFIESLFMLSHLHNYLRIGETFVFFMDLSKYFFLQQVTETIHNTHKKVSDEIYGHSEIAWDYLMFEDRYGQESITCITAIENVYTRFESEIIKFLRLSGKTSISQYQIKKWFFMRLAGNIFTELDKALAPQHIDDLNKSIDEILKENLSTIGAYREIVKKSICEATFFGNKASMEGIIANLLELLAHLKEKEVAMRDLKPDNLLVAGDQDKFPGFLAYPEDYKIGLIDVETAVIFDEYNKRKIAQPQMGGTPHYATPSHFFQNDLLNKVFGDLSNTLHLQDWHAIVGIIYKVITGEFLFEKTAMSIPVIVRILRDSSAKVDKLPDIAIKVSRLFWRNAVIEFNEKIAVKRKILEAADIDIPETTNEMFKEYLSNVKRNLVGKIKKCVYSQKILTSTKNRKFLLLLSSEKTRQLEKKWRSGKELPPALSKHRTEILEFLKNLGSLKKQLERQTRMLNLFDQLSSKISAYQLLRIMFDIVLGHMYKDEWEDLQLDEIDSLSVSDSETTYQATLDATREWQTISL